MRAFEQIHADINAAMQGSHAETLRTLADEMDALRTPHAVSIALSARGVACTIKGEHRMALTHLEQALAINRERGDVRGTALTMNTMGLVCTNLGEHERALEFYRRAIDGALSITDQVTYARIVSNMGSLYVRLGDNAAALEWYSRALDIFDQQGMSEVSASTLVNISTVFVETADYPRALEYGYRALRLFEEQGNRFGVAHCQSNLGMIYSATGDHSQAIAMFRSAADVHHQLGNDSAVANARGNLGVAMAANGDLAGAISETLVALRFHEEHEEHQSAERVGIALIAALIEDGRYDDARTRLTQRAYDSSDAPSVRAGYHALLASLTEREGAVDEAVAHLHAARTIASQAGLKMQAAQYHQRLRDLAQRRNDFASYIEHNNEFTRITEEIRGKEATQRIAMMEAERKVEGERREREKERSLLYGALPRSVAERMIRGEDVSGDHYDHAAILFLDVVNFTTHTAHMHPADVVKMLEQVFREIDELCETYGVVKIKTIGDSYMCFRGDADPDTNAGAVAAVAIAVMNKVFMWPSGERLFFRAGIHCGPVTAGVLGTQRLQYDVWGDTVNVASRMESTGEAGRIHISAAFAAEIESRVKDQETNHESGIKNAIENAIENVIENREYRIEERGMIDVKGKGLMRTYWLERSDR